MVMIPRHRVPSGSASLLLSLVWLLAPGAASAPLTLPQQTCVRALNGGLARVAQAQGRANSQCIKDGRRARTSKLGPAETIEGCLTADVRGKVARKEQANIEKGFRKCTSPLPDFATTDAATGNAAAVAQERSLIHDVFNIDLDASIVLLDDASSSPNSTISRCQEKVASQTQKCMDTRLREYNKCKRSGLRGGKPQTLYAGAEDPFDDATDLELCMGWDRKSNIARCVTRLAEKIDVNCECVALGQAIPGACFDSPEPAICLGNLTACRSCLLLNEADDLNQDCDAFDDGLINGSCPPLLRSCDDGIVQEEAGEECDDGGSAGGDGCDASCQQEPGFVCKGEPSSCAFTCGDSNVDTDEECDDGNLTDGDGCSDNCEIESGFSCAGAVSTCDPACGDGLVRGSEECDDGNTGDGDGCSSTCEVEAGFVCPSEPAFLECEEPSSCAPTCGDGAANPGEDCDDGNTNDGDGCSGACQVEPGFECIGVPSVCTPGLNCGNGVIDLDEECDDGNANDGDCCSSSCQIELAGTVCRAVAGGCDVAETCSGVDPNCPTDVLDPAGTVCRAALDAGCDFDEVCSGSDPDCPTDVTQLDGMGCDDADSCTGPDACLSGACVGDPACGNGSTELACAEECDDGNVNDGDCCSSTCQIELAGTECRAAAGGCDVAETCSGVDPSCPADALDPAGTVCRAALDAGCDFDEVCSGSDPDCPADVTQSDGTACDDGDLCTGSDACVSAVCVGGPVCGNGFTELGCGEECDDGNATNFDGCSDSCQSEIGSHKCVIDDPNEPIGFCEGGSNDGIPCVTAFDCPGGLCDPVSGLVIRSGFITITGFLSGALDIACSAVDPNTGKAACQCIIQDIDPFLLSGVGFICITPSDPNNPCDLGEIDCDGGNGLDVDVMSDHNIGACTGNPDCNSQCVTHCAGLGKSLFDAGCEGFCEGGSSDGSPCTQDSSCPGGACNGGDFLPHGNVCGCSCLDVGGVPSAAGGLQCNAGAVINVEIAAPCEGADVLIAVGTRCIPLTTEAVSLIIDNSDNLSGVELPSGGLSGSGTAAVCNDLTTSTTTGMVLAGAVNFFDSTLGDLAVGLTFTCR